MESLQTLRDWVVEESEYQIKAMESIEGLGAKGKHKEEDRRKNHTPRTSLSATCVKEVMEYRRVRSSEMQMSRKDGESPLTTLPGTLLESPKSIHKLPP